MVVSETILRNVPNKNIFRQNNFVKMIPVTGNTFHITWTFDYEKNNNKIHWKCEMKSINSTLRMKNLPSSMTRIILFGLLILKTVAASKDNDSPANSGNSGRYTVKEEVQKAPEVNHFCNLTRTSVKISFPEMKSRVFVNFLGYKEPNLIHLQRCKGRCGDTESSSCVPIRY